MYIYIYIFSQTCEQRLPMGRNKTVFDHMWAWFEGLSTDAIFIRVHTSFHCFICLKLKHTLKA